ncbi:MAG: heme ABC transporter ATP-binding protein [Oleiphilus sp.]|nr:MAG: heme ABC transporter ATP-binding protein [Oleiphilus sp.]
MIRIKATNIAYQVKERRILTDINLELSEGEFTVLIGPNGSGKSSLLKILAGLEAPEKGEILFNNMPLKSYSTQQLSALRGVLSQSIHLGFPMRNQEIVKLGMPTRTRQNNHDELITSALAMTGSEHLADANYDHCSGGEKTRIQMSRILVQLWSSEHFPRQVLFLDEPTAALDLKFQLEVLRLCKALCDQGMTVFCILHDLQLAAHFADQILVMHKGTLIEQGTPSTVLKEDMIASIYGVNSHTFVHPANQKPMIVASP